ncbi:MAG: GNAT family N-acetyltransferase [Caulobacterales bacterium 32-69-10]|nr:MAG: GNAT family N-acetyltransferase [Caulobacterales bacterium 32-69-10]
MGKGRGPGVTGFTVRPATVADAAGVSAVYAHHVLHGFGTFEEAPPTAEDIVERMGAVEARSLPWRVAENTDGRILGYAYAGAFRTRAAYRYTAETSVYVADGLQGQGIGRALLASVIEACEAAGVRQLLAVIGGSENAGSIALHAAFGFEPVGTLRNVGFKAGRWVDVVMMQKGL